MVHKTASFICRLSYLYFIGIIFTPKNAERMSRDISSQTWLSSQFPDFYFTEPITRLMGGKTISELCDHDINLDTVHQTDLLDNPAAEDKCMFSSLLALSM
jgi:hypothetical protein